MRARDDRGLLREGEIYTRGIPQRFFENEENDFGQPVTADMVFGIPKDLKKHPPENYGSIASIKFNRV